MKARSSTLRARITSLYTVVVKPAGYTHPNSSHIMVSYVMRGSQRADRMTFTHGSEAGARAAATGHAKGLITDELAHIRRAREVVRAAGYTVIWPRPSFH